MDFKNYAQKVARKTKNHFFLLTFSLIFLICFSPLIFPSINSKLILKEVNASSSNYFGDGSDGDVTISSDTNLAAVEDGDMVLKQYTSLTINEGKTLTTDNRCKGLFIYVTGDVTINGTLTMTARGGKVDPVAAGVSATGIRLPMLKSGEADTLSAADFAGCGSNLINAVTNQSGISEDGKIFTIARAGAAGAAARTAPRHTGRTGYAGSAGGIGESGGGGGGGANSSTSFKIGSGGAGSAGTCFSGGTGGGGGAKIPGYNGVVNGGAGGAGRTNPTTMGCAGGGAGNPGGAHGGWSCGVAGNSGTGGLLVLVVGGNLTIDSTGYIKSNGTNGGGASGPNANAGGGASGGG